jgi:small-conductance mechanosensitive channel
MASLAQPILLQSPGKDIGKHIEALTSGTYHWATKDSGEALFAVAAGLALYALFFGVRWGSSRLFGPHHPITTWQGFVRRIVMRTRSPFMAISAAYFIVPLVDTPRPLQAFIYFFFTIACAVQGALWLREIILALVERRAAPGSDDHDTLASAMGIITVLVNVVVWVLATILILDNLGVNVTALVAGLGVGGIAIGLAAQGIFSDLFAALAILFDRPFRVGDTISYAGNTGTVEAIGLKTTRIRALSGEQLVMANTKLLEQQVSNMRRIVERRVVMQIGVIYQTPPDVLAAVPGVIGEVVRSAANCRFDRAHIFNFAASSIDIEFVFHVEQPDYDSMMDARQAICLGIMRRLSDMKVEFAYPTQTTFTAAPDGTMIDPRMMQPAAQ